MIDLDKIIIIIRDMREFASILRNSNLKLALEIEICAINIMNYVDWGDN